MNLCIFTVPKASKINNRCSINSVVIVRAGGYFVEVCCNDDVYVVYSCVSVVAGFATILFSKVWNVFCNV